MQLKKTIYDYLEYLEIEKGRSSHTIRNYTHYLFDFYNWLQQHLQQKKITPKHITQATLRKYRLKLSRQTTPQDTPLKTSTQNYYLIALRNLLKYFQKNDIVSLTPEKIELATAKRPQIKTLTTQKINQLCQVINTDKLQGLRDRTIIELLFSTGLRVSELTALEKQEINLQSREVMIRGKGDKDRLVFISTTAAGWLHNYLQKRTDNYRPIFIRHKGQAPNSDPLGLTMRLSNRSVERMIKKYALRAGIVQKVTPHTLRHTFATDLLQNGADLRSVQELLGHSNVQTTQIYTHVTNPQLKEIHKTFHGKTRSEN